MPPVIHHRANITATADQLNIPGMKTASAPRWMAQIPIPIGQFVFFMHTLHSVYRSDDLHFLASGASIATVNVAMVLRSARMALACVVREYPVAVAHVLRSSRDLLTQRDLHPAFYGCFDWHSAVHNY